MIRWGLIAEFCRCMSEDSQITQIANAILPHLLKVIIEADVFGVHTRSRAVHIYSILSEHIFSLSLSTPVSNVQSCV